MPYDYCSIFFNPDNVSVFILMFSTYTQGFSCSIPAEAELEDVSNPDHDIDLVDVRAGLKIIAGIDPF